MVEFDIYADGSDKEDWCGCKQYAGQEPIVCGPHQAIQRAYVAGYAAAISMVAEGK